MSDAAAQVKMDAGEIKSFLNYIIENNRFLQNKGLSPVATEIVGESGLGKTTIVMDVAAEQKEAGHADFAVVKLNLAQIEELGDLVGYPIRQFQLCKEATDVTPKVITSTPQYKMVPKVLANGTKVMVKEEISVPVLEQAVANLTDDCVWVDEMAVEQYTKRGYNFTGRKQMSYCPPEWIAGKEGGGILILDDWNRADYNLFKQVACGL